MASPPKSRFASLKNSPTDVKAKLQAALYYARKERKKKNLFDPSLLFNIDSKGAWYDPSDIKTLFQDSAGSTPVTALGQPVGRMLDKSGQGNNALQATAAARPTYARVPVGGVRNRANGSAAVSDSAFWPVASEQDGVTATRIGQGIDTDGLPYADIRYTGTTTNNFQATAYSRTNSRFPAVQGETWTASVRMQLIAGAIPRAGSGVRVAVRELTAAGEYLTENGEANYSGATESLRSHTRTLTSPSVGLVETAIILRDIAIGDVVDVTYRFKGLQLESGSVTTPYQANMSVFDITETGRGSRSALFDDLVDDTLATTLPAGTYTIATIDDAGVTILTGQVLSAGSYTIPGPRRLYGAVIINRALSESETASLTAWLNPRRP